MKKRWAGWSVAALLAVGMSGALEGAPGGAGAPPAGR